MSVSYVKDVCNTFRDYSKLPKVILDKIIENNDSIFKLLTLSNPTIIEYEDLETNEHIPEMKIDGENLTKEEKRNLVYRGGNYSDEYRIQLQKSTDDALQDTQCRLHIYIHSIIPYTAYDGIINIAFQIICHNKFNMINDGERSRVDCVTEELMNFLIGLELELDGIHGGIMFDYRESEGKNQLKNDISNIKNLFGDTLILSVRFSQKEVKGFYR